MKLPFHVIAKECHQQQQRASAATAASRPHFTCPERRAEARLFGFRDDRNHRAGIATGRRSPTAAVGSPVSRPDTRHQLTRSRVRSECHV